MLYTYTGHSSYSHHPSTLAVLTFVWNCGLASEQHLPQGAEWGWGRLFLLCFLCQVGGVINQWQAGKITRKKILIITILLREMEKTASFSVVLHPKWSFLIESIDRIKNEQIIKWNTLKLRVWICILQNCQLSKYYIYECWNNNVCFWLVLYYWEKKSSHSHQEKNLHWKDSKPTEYFSEVDYHFFFFRETDIYAGQMTA